MTFEDWQKREGLQADWEATWNLPHMQAGLEVIRRAIEPKGTTTPDINTNALKNAYTEGCFATLAVIERLKPQDSKTNKPLPAPWEHVKRETPEE